ncbi:MAG: hypothetical protein AB1806_18470 [Acidobacteriota bacterium]
MSPPADRSDLEPMNRRDGYGDRRVLSPRSALMGVLVLSVFNVAFATTLFVGRWLVFQAPKERAGFAVYVFSLTVMAGWAYARPAFRERALQASLVLATMGIASGIVELALSTFPGLLPDRILAQSRYLSLKAQGLRPESVEDVLEHLPESPWVKFKPHVRVRSMRYRGDDFAAEWTTDALGFKNPPEVAGLRRLTAIAVGDSFVEAMGVPVEDQWSALLSRAGHPTYSMGVQGYAPQQAVGTLRRYGHLFRAHYVIFGFTPGFERRTGRFADPSAVVTSRRYEGGIESINQYLKEVHNREYRFFPALNAVLTAAHEEWNLIQIAGRIGPFQFKDDATLARRRREIAIGASFVFDPHAPDWQRTIDSLREAARLSRDMDAQLVVLLFASRQSAYFEEAAGFPIPDDHYEVVEARTLRRFCREDGIPLVSVQQDFADYARNARATGRQLPYFDIDGHPNEVGQQLIAARMTEFLRARQGEPE